MAICDTCGKQIRDDIWTCGFCGAPVTRPAEQADTSDSAYGSEGYNPYASAAAADLYAGAAPGASQAAYGAATTSYAGAGAGMTPYGTPAPQAKPASSGGLSGLTKVVLVGAGLAVLAIVLLWFFALRETTVGGDQFVGEWQAVDTKTGSLVIAKSEGGLEITLVSSQGGKAGPFKGDLQDDQLELTFEAANDDESNKAVANVLKAFLAGALEDPHLFLTVRNADGHLVMSISGKDAAGGSDVNAQAAEYVKGGGV